MIKKNVEEMLNKQVNAELYSAYLYLSMEAYFKSKNLMGAANWMNVQTKEELIHAMKIYNFIIDRDGIVKLDKIEAPPSEWENAEKVFEYAYQHEIKVTESINNLVALSIKENDFATHNFLQWFVSEQVEEEASVKNVLERLKLAGNSPDALFIIDNELAQRVFVPPTQQSENA
ncbi:MAG TPA: ferritin [bacterium]|nr:ferritin [bacterium]HPQ19912.1 ferritin [bacterium]